AQAFDARVAELLVGVDDGLGIRARVELVAARFEVALQFLVVVYLAVEDDADARVAARHRLVAAGEVDDRESPHADGGAAQHLGPLLVRPAVLDPPAHAVEERRTLLS